jgi:anti-anti-sigma regulatory factor
MRIERESRGKRTTIRLIGHFQSEHIEELVNQIQQNGPQVVLDLREVTLVDVDVIRFLGSCEIASVKIVHCSQYIREWIDRERKFGEIG